MGKLSSSARKAMPKASFAMPGGTKKSSAPAFPMNNKSHARAAISGATRSQKAGNITPAQAARVKAAAKAKLGTPKKKSK